MRLFRPTEDQSVFFGPILDVSRNVSYSPLQTKS
jgi:hypothetical protein